MFEKCCNVVNICIMIFHQHYKNVWKSCNLVNFINRSLSIITLDLAKKSLYRGTLKAAKPKLFLKLLVHMKIICYRAVSNSFFWYFGLSTKLNYPVFSLLAIWIGFQLSTGEENVSSPVSFLRIGNLKNAVPMIRLCSWALLSSRESFVAVILWRCHSTIWGLGLTLDGWMTRDNWQLSWRQYSLLYYSLV